MSTEDATLLLETDETRPSPQSLAGVFLKFSTDSYCDPKAKIFWQLFSKLILTAQVFDYGDFSEPSFKREAKAGGELLGEGLLEPPYPAITCHYTLTEVFRDEDPNDTIPLAFNGRARYVSAIAGPFAHEDSRDYFVADFIRIPRQVEGNLSAGKLYHGTNLWWCAGAGIIGTRQGGAYTGSLYHMASTREIPSQLGSLADGIAALSMILCTKGIRMHREEPSAKLNKKRIAHGKAALTLVTYVDARSYFEAAARTDRGGTHASPIPHLRRGHIRQYSDGHKTWVKPMLVNCRSVNEIRKRDHYTVKTEDLSIT